MAVSYTHLVKKNILQLLPNAYNVRVGVQTKNINVFPWLTHRKMINVCTNLHQVRISGVPGMFAVAQQGKSAPAESIPRVACIARYRTACLLYTSPTGLRAVINMYSEINQS